MYKSKRHGDCILQLFDCPEGQLAMYNGKPIYEKLTDGTFVVFGHYHRVLREVLGSGSVFQITRTTGWFIETTYNKIKIRIHKWGAYLPDGRVVSDLDNATPLPQPKEVIRQAVRDWLIPGYMAIRMNRNVQVPRMSEKTYSPYVMPDCMNTRLLYIRQKLLYWHSNEFPDLEQFLARVKPSELLKFRAANAIIDAPTYDPVPKYVEQLHQNLVLLPSGGIRTLPLPN